MNAPGPSTAGRADQDRADEGRRDQDRTEGRPNGSGPHVRNPDAGLGGLLDRLPPWSTAPALWAWLGPVLVSVLAFVLRAVRLDRPHELVFDETYYVKQAYSLLRLGYEGRWAEGADELFAAGDTSALLAAADYVVHPPLGKWLIAAGMGLLGQESAVGWRISGAVIGALTVLVLARLGRRLSGSTLLGCLAGLLLAVDGMHIVLSRTGILDVFFTFFTVAAFAAVVVDRVTAHERLDRLVAASPPDPWGPRLGPRWWLLVAGVMCGLAIGVKWSGVYVLATLGILTVVWSALARRAAGVRLWIGAGLLRDGVVAFLALVPVAALTYLATWTSWFANPNAYMREPVDPGSEAAVGWLPDALESWWAYHRAVWGFHHGLSSSHAYEAGPLGWLVQWRPTSFFWGDAPGDGCGAGRCVQAIVSVGNPLLWWIGVVGLVAVIWAAVRLRDWRAWTVLAGYLAVWVPWFAYPDRTTFTFYAVALAPFVALAVTYVLALLLGWHPGSPAGTRALLAVVPWRTPWPWLALGVVVLILVVSAFFLPVWTADVITYEQWQRRMWLPSWI